MVFLILLPLVLGISPDAWLVTELSRPLGYLAEFVIYRSQELVRLRIFLGVFPSILADELKVVLG